MIWYANRHQQRIITEQWQRSRLTEHITLCSSPVASTWKISHHRAKKTWRQMDGVSMYWSSIWWLYNLTMTLVVRNRRSGFEFLPFASCTAVTIDSTVRSFNLSFDTNETRSTFCDWERWKAGLSFIDMVEDVCRTGTYQDAVLGELLSYSTVASWMREVCNANSSSGKQNMADSTILYRRAVQCDYSISETCLSWGV